MKTPKVPYSRKPAELELEEWQTLLRKQYATEQKFKVKNIGEHPYFSDFEVFNLDSGNSYKVSIRDNISSHHFCTCPDFSINGLGTCKHIEYLLQYFEQYKKYNKYINSRQKNHYSSLSVVYGKERKIRLKKADAVKEFEDEKEYFDSKGYLLDNKLIDLESFIQKAKSVDSEFRIYPDIFEFINRVKKEQQRKILVKELFPDGLRSSIFNDLINAQLFPYQKEGVIRILETGRILLADDMGLGKTIQAIAATELFHTYLNVKKVLIICPTSLKYQWKREIEKFSGKESNIIEGLIHKRKDLYREDDFIKIISYGVCRNDLEFISGWKPDLVIIDEAQRIKNWKTQTAQSVKKIKSEYCIVLTGTPLENRIDEIHSIVEYIDRFRLGALFRFLHNHQVVDENGKLIGYKDLRTINKTLEKILIRRTKKEIADQLPDRLDKNFFVEMTEEQMTDHNDYYEVVTKLVNKWIKTGHLTEEERQRLLTCLNCMRMVCDSTYILNQNTNHGNKIKEISDLMDDVLQYPENKLVIFSQWKRMFDLLIRELEKRKIDYVYLNGDIPASERKTIIEKFQDDPELKIFLSTDAGGVGVNLQSANILINMDLPWNPAVLEQRIGRIYRLGQKNHIHVFNFISRGSIEHRILYLLDFKKSVFTGVIEEEGKDEVMLEGFLQSVRALTEIDTESYSGSFRKNEMEREVIFKVNEPEIDPTPPGNSINIPVESKKDVGIIPNHQKKIGNSLLNRLGGFIRKAISKLGFRA